MSATSFSSVGALLTIAKNFFLNPIMSKLCYQQYTLFDTDFHQLFHMAKRHLRCYLKSRLHVVAYKKRLSDSSVSRNNLNNRLPISVFPDLLSVNEIKQHISNKCDMVCTRA